MKKFVLFIYLSSVSFQSYSQHLGSWSEEDRQFLLKNLLYSKEEFVKETSSLSEAQWNFKETPDRWSIREITEHIALWEFILQREISVAIGLGPNIEKKQKTPPDSVIIQFILEEKKHVSNDYTYPYTYSQPMGNNTGEDNILWFLKMRNESIDYLKTAKEDLRNYFLAGKATDVHQRFITTYGHCLRHVRQIKNVKLHKNYPKF